MHRSSPISPSTPTNCVPLRVLHVLDHSWPVLDGYSQRSRNLLRAQRDLGLVPTAVTSPLHQQDESGATDVQLNGVTYHRTPWETDSGVLSRAIRKRWPLLREAGVVTLLRRRLESLLSSGRFDIVHAHSPALCGLAALQACRPRGIPFVYEIRSFWEDSNVELTTLGKYSPRYRLARSLETYVVRRADAVAGISRAILDEIATRGVSHGRLFHLPNGVDIGRFSARPRDLTLARELGIDSAPTIGYVGTFFPWEGVPWMVRAVAELHKKGFNFQALIIGDGVDAPNVQLSIQHAGAQEYIRYLGRVPNDKIERYYSLIDILVYPRLRTRLTEMVTPLKPLEAMALGKTVLASAVGGHRELIAPEVSGLLFEPENIEDFCRHASRLMQDPTLLGLGEKARAMVSQQRDWSRIVPVCNEIYNTAMANARSLR